MGLARFFYSSWCNITINRHAELLEHWDNRRAFTKLIIHSDKSVLCDIAKRIDLECYNADYYHIDAVLYKPEDRLPGNFGYYLTNIRIAFEHENDFNSGLYQEVCRLLQVNSELNVLVAYPGNSEAGACELKSIHEIISRSRQASEIATNEGFLIIMGYTPHEWEGWLYDTQSWINITT